MESLSGSPPDWLGVRTNLPDSLRRFVSILRQSWVSSQSNESIITSSNVRASRSSALGFTDGLCWDVDGGTRRPQPQTCTTCKESCGGMGIDWWSRAFSKEGT